MRRDWSNLFTFGLIILAVSLNARAATIGELRSSIEDHNAEIRKLEVAIMAYQKELRLAENASKNLKSEIARLEITRRKLETDIKITEQKIAKTDLTVAKLVIEIGQRDDTLARRRAAVGASLRQWRLVQDQTLVELVVNYDKLSDAWNELSQLGALQRNLSQDIAEIITIKADLEQTKTEAENERQELARLKERLRDQRQIAQKNQTEKDRLLNVTKNKEANYKQLLTETVARKAAFEKELFDLESQLRISIDQSKLPPPGRGVLKWPLENVYITQQFGKTVDAKRLYASGTHNGIDLRASIGMPVLAAAAGRVKGVGDTDLSCRGASYGQWVLIEHANGLSTIYGHLSLIKAAPEQVVAAGEMIGYSGQTGYSTGPHLHLTVVATQGVRLDNYNFRSCAGAKITMPLADPAAYLDPLLYL